MTITAEEARQQLGGPSADSTASESFPTKLLLALSRADLGGGPATRGSLAPVLRAALTCSLVLEYESSPPPTLAPSACPDHTSGPADG